MVEPLVRLSAGPMGLRENGRLVPRNNNGSKGERFEKTPFPIGIGGGVEAIDREDMGSA